MPKKTEKTKPSPDGKSRAPQGRSAERPGVTDLRLEKPEFRIELVREGDQTFTERFELLESTRRDVLARISELQDTLAVLDRKISFYADAGRVYEKEKVG